MSETKKRKKPPTAKQLRARAKFARMAKLRAKEARAKKRLLAAKKKPVKRAVKGARPAKKAVKRTVKRNSSVSTKLYSQLLKAENAYSRLADKYGPTSKQAEKAWKLINAISDRIRIDQMKHNPRRGTRKAAGHAKRFKDYALAHGAPKHHAEQYGAYEKRQILKARRGRLEFEKAGVMPSAEDKRRMMELRRQVAKKRNANEPTAEQLKAIRQFASVNGRSWKSELRYLWETGAYHRAALGGADPGYLQQVRNQFGPGWLRAFKISKTNFHRGMRAAGKHSNGSAAKLRREWSGRSGKVTNSYAPKGSGVKGTVIKMGELKKVYIKGRAPLSFPIGAAMLAYAPKASKRKDQMVVLGKKYRFKMKRRNPEGLEDLGEITQIEYIETKQQFGDQEPVIYYHKLGEEGGERPHAVINEEGLLLIEGGDYTITPEGIRD